MFNHFRWLFDNFRCIFNHLSLIFIHFYWILIVFAGFLIIFDGFFRGVTAQALPQGIAARKALPHARHCRTRGLDAAATVRAAMVDGWALVRVT